MKLLRNIAILILLVLFSGCSTHSIKYEDVKISWDQTKREVPHLFIKRIVEGTHTSNFYITYGIDTIYYPIGNPWLVEHHIILFTTIATTKEDKRRKGLMLHENMHCLFDRGYLPEPPIGHEQWHTEQYGYATQIRYLILNDVTFSIIDRAKFIKYLTDDIYNDMCTLGEATYFVNYIVRQANKEKKELDS